MNKLLWKLIYYLVCAAMIFSLGVHYSFAAPVSSPSANTIRVSTTGVDTTGCGSATQPCKSIQYAVNQASSGDTILVASGIYKYNQIDNCTFLVTRAVVCLVNKQLIILGGYSAGNWSVPDPVNNLTIIDGEAKWRGVAVIGYNSTATLRMEGFTVQNGHVEGRNSGDQYFRNAFGGGMWAQNSAVDLKKVIFKNNVTIGGSNLGLQIGGWGLGGGLAIEASAGVSPSKLEEITFTGNQSLGGDGGDCGGIAQGGGFFVSQAPVSGTKIVFTNNIAKSGKTSGTGNNSGNYEDALGGAASFANNASINFSFVTATANQALGGSAGSGSNARGRRWARRSILCREYKPDFDKCYLSGKSSSWWSGCSWRYCPGRRYDGR